MQRVGVGLGIDRHRPDAEPLAGADDATGDLATVGDQDLVEGRLVSQRLAFGRRPWRGFDRRSRRLRRSFFRGLLLGGHAHDPSLLRSRLLRSKRPLAQADGWTAYGSSRSGHSASTGAISTFSGAISLPRLFCLSVSGPPSAAAILPIGLSTNERGSRIHNHQVDSAGAGQRARHLQSFFRGTRLGEWDTINLRAQTGGVCGVEGAVDSAVDGGNGGERGAGAVAGVRCG